MLSRSSLRTATATARVSRQALGRNQTRSLSRNTITQTGLSRLPNRGAGATHLPPACLTSSQSVSIRRYSSSPMAAPTDTVASEVQNSTGITPETMAATLREKLNASHVDIQDISGGCGQSFAALIVSPQFAGKAALARHRLVNGVLKEEIAAIHAWTPRCLTPEQWEKEKEKIAGQ